MKKKVYWGIGIIALLVVAYGWLAGYRFTMSSAISAGFHKDYRVILSEDMPGGKAVLYEDTFHGTFGVGKLHTLWGLLYAHGGEGGSLRAQEDGQPFELAGYGSGGDDIWFLVGIRVRDDSQIRYLSAGNHLKDLAYDEPYTMTLDDVKANPNHYEWEEATGRYALLVLDDYTEENWTIRALDQEGKLIADKPFAAQPRYLDQQQP
ncbi:hypothetical protein [Paenibacillus sp. NPDC057967]|uniref:hypothetical protein n=1 Tax=Paenibacillus sp. NPDC057967 TaxID=3346293 RepID=UPI0036DCA2B6